MTATFKPDIFSVSKPKWTKGSFRSAGAVENLLPYLPGDFSPQTTLLEYAGGFELNSNNFKLTSGSKRIIVKRWSKAAKKDQLNTVLGTMEWLSDTGMPVPKPARFSSQGTLQELNGYYWSYYPFVEGDYFSGKGTELENAACITAKLTALLSEMPKEFQPGNGPEHLTADDNAILEEANRVRKDWPVLFGLEYAVLLNDCWQALVETWERLYVEKSDAGPVIAVHFDLHPHNLIFNNFEASAILDFEACKLMPVGYALSFAALKQCRQTMACEETISSASVIGKKYTDILGANFKTIVPFVQQFSDLASAEAIRRICIILRLNIRDSNKDWNSVLPIQLGHLAEAKALFSK